MRKPCLVLALSLVACGGIELPRSDRQGTSGGGSGTGNSGAGAGGSSASTGIAGWGNNISINPNAGVGGGLSVGGGGEAAGAAGYEPTTRTTGVCTLERIASRQSEAGAGGEGGGAVAEDAASAGPGAEDDSDELALGQGDLTLLVVFDKSGSMDTAWDERSKWQVANDALMKAIDPVIDNLTLGTIFFPQPAGGCEVLPLGSELQIGFRTGRDFRSYWQETQATRAPNGSTPLERSLQMADLAIDEGCRLGLLNDRFRVVLVTDGEPTCGDDHTALVELVADWNRAGVETWVMGLPGSDPAKTLLDAIAQAGSTGESQSLGTPGELDHGLAEAAR